jgi:hypothetical protein
MDDRLIATCEREFANYIEGLFKTVRKIPSTGMAEIPVIGGMYHTWADHSHLCPQIVAALCCRERFRQDAPDWPILPLHEKDIEAMENDGCLRCNLVGFYADSLSWEIWDYERHPPFAAFASGLMAYKHTPGHLRNDRALRQEFPPRKLKGLCDGWLAWRSPERLALARRMKRLCAAAEAREAAGSAG